MQVIETIREKAGLSVTEMARKLGITRGCYYRRIAGDFEGLPSMKTLDRLCKIAGWEWGELMAAVGDEISKKPRPKRRKRKQPTP